MKKTCTFGFLLINAPLIFILEHENFGASSSPLSHKTASNTETIRALKVAHALWKTKRKYFKNKELDWIPKYNETDVGIEKFANKIPGIGGIIKGTWSDFVVHELRQDDGSVVEISEESGEKGQFEKVNFERKKWLRFVLCKMGIDTISAIRQIAAFCNLKYLMVIMMSTLHQV